MMGEWPIQAVEVLFAVAGVLITLGFLVDIVRDAWRRK